MLLYFSFVILLNLVIGYALGVYLGPPPVALPWVRGGEPGEPLVRPANKSENEPTATGAEDPSAAPYVGTLAQSMPSVTETEVLSGLAAFQSQLESLGAELESKQHDEHAFGEQANKIHEANQAYLQTAAGQIGQLDPQGQAHQSVAAGVEQVDKASKEFDAFLDEGVADPAVREQLVAKSTEITERVSETHAGLKEQVEEIKQQRDAATGLATLDSLIAQIEDVLNDGGNEQLRSAVLIRSDPFEGDDDPELQRMVREKLAGLVNARLRDKGEAAELEDGQYLVLMEEAELTEIIDQIDALRQQIDQTTFARGDKTVRATVTCAVADLPGAKTRDAAIARLEQAMAESRRHGSNHTFHHDGSFASVVEPSTQRIEAQTIEL